MGFSFHLSKLPLHNYFGEKFRNLVRKYKNIEITNHFYKPGGYDQVNLVTNCINTAESLLYDSVIVSAIKDFNLRLMKKGACVYSRYHCFDLADEIFKKEETKNRAAERGRQMVPENVA